MSSEAAPVRCPVCQQEDCDCPDDVVQEARARIEAGAEPLVDASNPSQVAARARTAKRTGDEAANDLSWLMRHPQGRRVMWRLLDKAGIFRNAFVVAEGQTNQTNFHLGAQNLGLDYFVTVMRQEPDGYNLMVKENSANLRSE